MNRISKDISNSIDIIRGMAALGVIWGHSMYGLNFASELNGAFWVWIFISVSGYLVGRGFIDCRYDLSLSGYKKFLFNRALRIIPLYEIALCLGFLFEQISSKPQTEGLSVLRQMMFAASDVSLAGPLWTVAVEVQFYIVSILFIMVFVRYPFLPFLVFFLIVSFVFAGLYNGNVYGYFFQPRTLAGNIHFFIFGLFLSTKTFKTLFFLSRSTKALIIAFLIITVWYIANWLPPGYFWFFGKDTNKYVPLGGASLIALFVSFIVLTVNHKDSDKFDSFVVKIFGPIIRFLGWCGFYTYGIYVWHSVLGKSNTLFFHIPIGPYYFLFLLLSIPIGFLSYKFIEKPLLQLKFVNQ